VREVAGIRNQDSLESGAREYVMQSTLRNAKKVFRTGFEKPCRDTCAGSPDSGLVVRRARVRDAELIEERQESIQDLQRCLFGWRHRADHRASGGSEDYLPFVMRLAERVVHVAEGFLEDRLQLRRNLGPVQCRLQVHGRRLRQLRLQEACREELLRRIVEVTANSWELVQEELVEVLDEVLAVDVAHPLQHLFELR